MSVSLSQQLMPLQQCTDAAVGATAAVSARAFPYGVRALLALLLTTHISMSRPVRSRQSRALDCRHLWHKDCQSAPALAPSLSVHSVIHTVLMLCAGGGCCRLVAGLQALSMCGAAVCAEHPLAVNSWPSVFEGWSHCCAGWNLIFW